MSQIRRNLRIWLHLLEKSLMESFIFCAVWNFDALESQKGICKGQILKSWQKDIWTKVRILCHFLNISDKIFKSYLEALRQQFTMSTNNRLRWNFLLVAKTKIHFDIWRIL